MKFLDELDFNNTQNDNSKYKLLKINPNVFTVINGRFPSSDYKFERAVLCMNLKFKEVNG